MASKRLMLRREFWLNLHNPLEEELANVIDELKQNRLFASTIRDGIRLICDLRAGHLDILFELFPWVQAEFLEYMQSLQPTVDETYIEKRLDRVEQLLLQQGNIPVDSTSRPKPLKVPQVAGPIYDETDDLLIVKKVQTDGQSARNFLDSAFGLIQ